MTEMEEAKMYRQASISRKWFERVINSAKKEYKGYYTYYSSTTKEVEVDGVKVEVELHTVGHNASHEFSIGILEDGRIVYKSVGECGEGQEGETLYNENIDVLKLGETPSYIGHW
jgi:prolyl-tRNA synthetase